MAWDFMKYSFTCNANRFVFTIILEMGSSGGKSYQDLLIKMGYLWDGHKPDITWWMSLFSYIETFSDKPILHLPNTVTK